jgi:hypothetical protein
MSSPVPLQLKQHAVAALLLAVYDTVMIMRFYVTWFDLRHSEGCRTEAM